MVIIGRGKSFISAYFWQQRQIIFFVEGSVFKFTITRLINKAFFIFIEKH